MTYSFTDRNQPSVTSVVPLLVRSQPAEGVIRCLNDQCPGGTVIGSWDRVRDRWSNRETELSDLKLFRITNGSAQELKGKSVALEVSLQRLIEANMETLFGVRFLATEYSTGAKHRGRIDSLGLDETGSPVIFEYKLGGQRS
jgi:hypothetical protein